MHCEWDHTCFLPGENDCLKDQKSIVMNIHSRKRSLQRGFIDLLWDSRLNVDQRSSLHFESLCTCDKDHFSFASSSDCCFTGCAVLSWMWYPGCAAAQSCSGASLKFKDDGDELILHDVEIGILVQLKIRTATLYYMKITSLNRPNAPTTYNWRSSLCSSMT